MNKVFSRLGDHIKIYDHKAGLYYFEIVVYIINQLFFP